MEDMVAPVFDRFFLNKRVFVTGHTGFKGSWLCLWLHALGAGVTGYALDPPTEPSLFSLCRVGQLVNAITGDVRDAESLQRALREASPEIVIHMAAQAIVRDSYRDPVETYAVNLMGTVHLLEAMRRQPGVKAVVVVTTDKCYENREWVWGYRESEPLGGHDPYSSSKACAELVTAAYRHSFFRAPYPFAGGTIFPQVATARAGNVIGGGDWAKDRLIPDCIRALTSGQTLKIRNPSAVRPWQHVLEPLAGYLMLAKCLAGEGAPFAEAWNFGSREEDARSVGWIAQRFAERIPGFSWERDLSDQPHEANVLRLDSAKAGVRLGWRPRWPLETVLEMTMAWYEAWQQGQDMRDVSLRQIADYEKHLERY
jgi:CDP-glucose 4,6-dehydratase